MITDKPNPRRHGRAALHALQERLGKLTPKFSAAEQVLGQHPTHETVSDDLGTLEGAVSAQIQREEQLVRAVLQLFDVDYDALISAENGSPYAHAVRQQPDILALVKQADYPVLAALQVALGHKPYADFAAKYGQEPEEIRAKLKAELQEELKQERRQQEAQSQPASKTTTALPFTERTTAAVAAKAKPRHRLEDIFSVGR